METGKVRTFNPRLPLLRSTLLPVAAVMLATLLFLLLDPVSYALSFEENPKDLEKSFPLVSMADAMNLLELPPRIIPAAKPFQVSVGKSILILKNSS